MTSIYTKKTNKFPRHTHSCRYLKCSLTQIRPINILFDQLLLFELSESVLSVGGTSNK